MPLDVDAMAAEVVLAIKTALAPVLERLAAADARLSVLGDLRDRVVAVETKAAMVPLADPVLGELRDRVVAVEHKAVPIFEVPADLLARLAAVEMKAAQPVIHVPDPALGELRDRLLVVETKAALPLRLDVSDDIMKRLVALEGLPSVSIDDVSDLRDRITTVETRSAGPSVTDMGLVDVRERVTAIERRVTDDALAKELGSLRERVAVVEVRAPVAGPAGKDGQDGASGKDGAAGKDGEPGTAGLSFEGVYQDGKSYEFGNLVTWGGSSWHCNEVTTTKPGDGSKAWTLMVKRGRDGKDGRDGTPPAIPVVSVGGPRS